jgi:hypothetical protein
VAKTVVIDKVDQLRVMFEKGADGGLLVYAEFALKAGGNVVQYRSLDVTDRVNSSRKSAALTLFDGILQDVSASELA